jgi:short-subunit dehydrogenase
MTLETSHYALTLRFMQTDMGRRNWRNLMNDTTHKGTALITGASSGIGAVYADRLARRGYDLILVARNRERLDALANRLTSATGRSVEVVPADLGLKADVRRVEDILRTDSSITMLVNNAGIGGAGPLLVSDVDKMEAMIELNVTALTRLSYAIAPVFVARGKGTIINIASIVAVAPEVLNGVYGGTKAFVLAFSQSLHHELGGKGIRVQAVLPGATRTEFWDIAGQPVENLPQGIVMSADDLVDAALAGLDLGEFATAPSLPDAADWEAFEAARAALGPNLSRSQPAARYGVRSAV